MKKERRNATQNTMEFFCLRGFLSPTYSGSFRLIRAPTVVGASRLKVNNMGSKQNVTAFTKTPFTVRYILYRATVSIFFVGNQAVRCMGNVQMSHVAAHQRNWYKVTGFTQIVSCGMKLTASKQ